MMPSSSQTKQGKLAGANWAVIGLSGPPESCD